MGISDPVLWFLFGTFLVISEFFLPGVVIIFFGLAGWIVSATTALNWTPSTTSQVLLFSIASVTSLLTLRRYVKGWFQGESQDTKDDLDEYIGREALTLEDLQPDTPGRLEFKGASWKCIAQVPVPRGSRVLIQKREGLTLLVTPHLPPTI